MNQLLSLGFIALFLLASTFCRAESSVDPQLIMRIQRNDTRAMAEAAASGNPAYIAYLRPKLSNKSALIAYPAEVSLVRLGDQQTMQQMYCEVKGYDHNNPAAITALPLVGGWYSINLLKQVILEDEDEQISVRLQSPRDSDVVADGLATSYALEGLGKLIGDPTAPARKADEKRVAREWVKWIDAHQETLSKLEPTGNGYTFTDAACDKKRQRYRSR